ncbi:MAG: glycosyltransferase family 2 protein [Thermoanaerobaculia bacterium]
MTRVSVVVPVYGDGAALDELVGRIAATLDAQGLAPWDVILVDDGSPGPCWQRIVELTKQRGNVRGIEMQRNFGQHNALLAGILASRGETVVTIDDDLQHPPEEIPRLLKALQPGVDLVYGLPAAVRHGPWRNLTSAVGKLVLASVMGARIAPLISAFRAFRGSLRGVLAGYRSPYVNLDVILNWGTSGVLGVSVRHDSRKSGRSQYTVRRLVLHWVNMVTGFSVWPLRVASLTGFVFLCFGFAVLVVVIVRYLGGGSVPGFPFLACIVTLFAGAQLFALGIIGEYMARLYFRSLDRLPFLIKSKINVEE